MKASETPTQSACGATNLLAAVFRLDSDELKLRLGLPHHETKQEKEARQESERERIKVYIICSYCGSLVGRNIKTYIAQRKRQEKKYTFCNKYCQGKFVAENFGFIAHPENCLGGIMKGSRKWNEAEFEELLNSDIHYRDICEIMDMPLGTFHFYKRRLLSESTNSLS